MASNASTAASACSAARSSGASTLGQGGGGRGEARRWDAWHSQEASHCPLRAAAWGAIKDTPHPPALPCSRTPCHLIRPHPIPVAQPGLTEQWPQSCARARRRTLPARCAPPAPLPARSAAWDSSSMAEQHQWVRPVQSAHRGCPGIVTYKPPARSSLPKLCRPCLPAASQTAPLPSRLPERPLRARAPQSAPRRCVASPATRGTRRVSRRRRARAYLSMLTCGNSAQHFPSRSRPCPWQQASTGCLWPAGLACARNTPNPAHRPWQLPNPSPAPPIPAQPRPSQPVPAPHLPHLLCDEGHEGVGQAQDGVIHVHQHLPRLQGTATITQWEQWEAVRHGKRGNG